MTRLKKEAAERRLHSFEQGRYLFRRAVTDVHILRKTYRFTDEVTKVPCKVLLAILEYMRQPNGK